MADYPSRVISGGAIIPCRGNSISRILQGGSLGYAARFSSFAYHLISSSAFYGLSRGKSLLIASAIPNVQSLAKIYFNNGFSQDTQFVYLSKSALGLPAGLNLSLEALFVVCILQWLNRKQGSEQKVEVILRSEGDKEEGYVYFTIEIIFKNNVLTDVYGEINNNFTISPLSF